MPALVTNNFVDDSIKNERASTETPFSYYKSMGIFLDAQGQLTLFSGPIWPKFQLVRDLLHVLFTCKYKKDRIKTTEKSWRHLSPHCKSMGAFCCHGNQSFDPICPKALFNLPFIPVMLHIKFDQDWQTSFRDIPSLKVWTADDGRTTDGPLVYYKLTL